MLFAVAIVIVIVAVAIRTVTSFFCGHSSFLSIFFFLFETMQKMQVCSVLILAFVACGKFCLITITLGHTPPPRAQQWRGNLLLLLLLRVRLDWEWELLLSKIPLQSL